MKRKLIAAIGVAGMMISIAACGSDDDKDTAAKPAGPESYKGQTLTVWAMDGSTPDQWQKDLSAAFEKKTGATVKFEVQKWDGIQQKLTTALSEENPRTSSRSATPRPPPTRSRAASPTSAT